MVKKVSLLILFFACTLTASEEQQQKNAPEVSYSFNLTSAGKAIAHIASEHPALTTAVIISATGVAGYYVVKSYSDQIGSFLALQYKKLQCGYAWWATNIDPINTQINSEAIAGQRLKQECSQLIKDKTEIKRQLDEIATKMTEKFHASSKGLQRNCLHCTNISENLGQCIAPLSCLEVLTRTMNGNLASAAELSTQTHNALITVQSIAQRLGV